MSARLIVTMACIVLAGPVAIVVMHFLRAASGPSRSDVPIAAPASSGVPSAAASVAGPASAGSGHGEFVGEWRVHGSTLLINKDLTGRNEWNAGPCEPMSSNLMCAGSAEITFTAAGDGLTGTITAISYADERGRVVPDFDPGEGAARVGDTFTLTVADAGVLKITGGAEGGNPYLCGESASEQWHAECNA